MWRGRSGAGLLTVVVGEGPAVNEDVDGVGYGPLLHPLAEERCHAGGAELGAGAPAVEIVHNRVVAVAGVETSGAPVGGGGVVRRGQVNTVADVLAERGAGEGAVGQAFRPRLAAWDAAPFDGDGSLRGRCNAIVAGDPAEAGGVRLLRFLNGGLVGGRGDDLQGDGVDAAARSHWRARNGGERSSSSNSGSAGRNANHMIHRAGQ